MGNWNYFGLFKFIAMACHGGYARCLVAGGFEGRQAAQCRVLGLFNQQRAVGRVGLAHSSLGVDFIAAGVGRDEYQRCGENRIGGSVATRSTTRCLNQISRFLRGCRFSARLYGHAALVAT